MAAHDSSKTSESTVTTVVAANESDGFTAHANCIEPKRLWLGDEEAAHVSLAVLRKHGITHILTCGFGLTMMYQSELKYLQLKAVDLPVFNVLQFVDKANAFITDALSGGGTVLVHCARGKSRSATYVVAWLMATHHLSFIEAHSRVRKARPEISINMSFRAQLAAYEELKWTIAGTGWAAPNANVTSLLAASVKGSQAVAARPPLGSKKPPPPASTAAAAVTAAATATATVAATAATVPDTAANTSASAAAATPPPQ